MSSAIAVSDNDVSSVIPIPTEGRCVLTQANVFAAWAHLQKLAPKPSEEHLRGFDDGVFWISNHASLADARRLGSTIGTMTINAIAGFPHDGSRCTPEEWAGTEQWFARNFPEWGRRGVAEHLGSHRFPTNQCAWSDGFLRAVRDLWAAVEPKL